MWTPRTCRCTASGRAGSSTDTACKPARVFTEFAYSTKKTKKGGWDCARRVVAKAEHVDGKESPRFVVTSLAGAGWIKEQFSLFANLYLSAMAYFW